MVLVRKTELACRDGWDHDLWEPKDGTAGGNGAGPSPTRSSDAVDPGRGTSLQGGRDRRSGASLGLSNGLSERFEGVAGTAVGLRDADESARRNQSGSVFESDWSPFDTPSLPFNRGRDSEPVDEIREETFSTRGRRIGVEHRAPDQSAEEAPTESQPEPSADERNGARPTDRYDLNPFNRSGPQESGQFGSPRHDFPESGRSEQGGVERGSYEPAPVEQSGMTEPFDVMDSEPDAPDPAQELEQGTLDSEEYGDEVMPAGDPYPDPDEADDNHTSLNVPMSLQQEQCCRTCRDFRPAEGGQHGWCNNPFAFEGRQRVDANDLPCHGTFGNWWSPADDWWIERADISHHSTPTPLVDEFINEGHEHADARSRSTQKHKSS